MGIALRTASAVLASALVFQSNATLSRAQTSVESELIALEHKWIDATLKGDARIRGKAEWVDGVRSGRLRYESVTLRNLKVRLYGDTAVVTGEYTQKATSDGQDYSARGAYATTWLNRGGRWQAIASGFSRATS